jgi:PAS domain S-box-containing protein
MAIFKSMRARIVWTFSLLVLINLASSYWSIYNFYSIANNVTTILRENYQAVLAAENMVKSLERSDNALLVASEGEDTTVVGRWTRWTENRDLFFYWFDQSLRAAGHAPQDSLRDSIQTTYRGYSLLADSMGARIHQGAFESAKEYYYKTVRPVSDKLRELCFRLFEENQEALYNAMPRTHSIANQTAFGTMMASLIALALSIIATAWLIRMLITPAEELTDKVKQIGMGKVDLKIDVLGDDEIGQLSREFNKMTERLRQYDELNIEKIISEKRKSEAIVEGIADGLIMTDMEQRIIHVNRVVADLFHFSEDRAIGRPVAAVIRDRDILAMIERHLQSPETRADLPMRIVRVERNGGVLYFRPKLTTVRGLEGDPSALLVLLQDITQFKELDRMKSDFIATVSHEFRTPVTSINMAVDILDQQLLGPLTPKQKELIGSAKEDCSRLTKLARELLQLAKLESGRQQQTPVELRMAEVVTSALHPLHIQFQEKGVRLVVDVPAELPSVTADEQQVSWVVTNLVTNALKYTPAGGTVTVRGRQEGDGMRVDVCDTGVGIAREHLQVIFDKFVQVKRTNDATPGSVGLGLAIAKDIVEMYGGRIWADSEPGRGSTFTFTLPGPAAQAAAPADAGEMRQ